MAGMRAVPAATNMAAIAVPLDLGFGDVGDEVVLVLAGRFEVPAPTMGTLLGINVVFEEDGARRRLRPNGAGVLAVLLPTTVGAGRLGIGPVGAGALPALADEEIGRASCRERVFVGV